jgi:hypothetical protein
MNSCKINLDQTTTIHIKEKETGLEKVKQHQTHKQVSSQAQAAWPLPS